MKRQKTTSQGDEKTAEVAPADSHQDVVQRVMDVAQVAARCAGRELKAHLGRADVKKTKVDIHDLVTAVDQRCEDIVRAHIARHFPDHAILGEEGVAPGAVAATAALEAVIDSEWLWIIDPIDGTTNFVHGLPGSVVSIGIAYKGIVTAGVVYDPARDEMFSAIKGKGSSLNGCPFKLSDRHTSTTMTSSLLFVGYPPRANVQEPFGKAAIHFRQNCRGVRGLGSAAIQCAYVAIGRCNAYIQHGLSAWDICAGVLLILEAGGVANDTRGDSYDLRVRDLVVSTSQTLQNEILGVLKKYGADSVAPPKDEK